MSINIKMDRYDMCISIHCHTSHDNYYVNTQGFLTKLEDFLNTLDSFDTVDIEIKKKFEEPNYGEFPFQPHTSNNTYTVSIVGGSGGDGVGGSTGDSGGINFNDAPTFKI